MTKRILETLGSLEGVEHIGHPTERAPHIACFHIVDVEPQALVLELDRRGFAVHSGSSCSSESLEPSPVLAAMGHDGQRSLRISVGWSTTEADVDALLSAVPQVLSESALPPAQLAVVAGWWRKTQNPAPSLTLGRGVEFDLSLLWLTVLAGSSALPTSHSRQER